MKKEFNDISCFKDWYKDQQEKMEKDPHMTLFNTKRVVTIHKEPVQPRADIFLHIKDSIGIGERYTIIETSERLKIKKSEKKPVTPPKTTGTFIEYIWKFDEIPDVSIIDLSKAHFEKLKKLVDTCEVKFH